MKKNMCLVLLLGIMSVLGFESCRKVHQPSTFVQSSITSNDLIGTKHRVLKQNAVGESSGAVFLWITMSKPTEAEAKQNMLQRLAEEGIDITGKKIVFSNATSDHGGFGFIGIIGSPSITLTADVLEVLE